MEDVRFSDGIRYDKGKQTSIDVSGDNIIVEAHKSPTHDTLWYHVGIASVYGVDLGPSHQYDKGVTPSISVNNFGIVVEVHKSPNHDTIWYHVGEVSENTINWGPSHQYDKGVNPSVSINDDGVVVEAHKSPNHDTIWYHVGHIEGDKINWGPSHQYDKGVHPNIAINNQGAVVEVHKSPNHDTIWYHAGNVNGQIINFGSSHQYDKGVMPSVSVNDEGIVVEVHKSPNHDTAWSHTGQLSDTIINFDRSIQYDTGENPSVGCNTELAIQSHKSENHDTLWYSTGLIVDHANWMGSEAGIGERELWEVTLPGSHDSGTYYLSNTVAPSGEISIPEWVIIILNIAKYISLPALIVDEIIQELLHDWGQAQEDNFGAQLNGGIRYFDLRPCYKDGNFYAYHGLIGPDISNILEQINSFMQNVQKELVIINVSHFCEFNDSRHEEFIKMITKTIGGYLYKESNSDLLGTKIDQYVENGPCVLLIYDDDYIVQNPQEGLWRNLKVYNKYSNTPSFLKMKDDQLEKLKQHPGNRNKMFLLSWTLTPDEDTIINDAINRLIPFKSHSSLHKLSAIANNQLAVFLKEYSSQYKINVLYVDFYVDAKATDLAISMNREL